jgi:methylated-DNA-[protein]-cysteine S-methyltransferase
VVGVSKNAAYYKSDIGIIEIVGTENGITSIDFFSGNARTLMDEDGASFFSNGIRETQDLPECISECIRQLDEYFRGSRRQFSLKLDIHGTDFQRNVWSQLTKIPYGKTATYGQIAQAAGNAKACRAVGNANNKNCLPIVIPCHRVVGTNGGMTGYAGGIWRKEWLLNHEKRLAGE